MTTATRPFLREARGGGRACGMTPRESVESKARRYLAEGRITVVRVDGDVADALVRGDTGEYHVSHDPAGGWRCTCPARGRCSHAAALKLITVRRRPA